MYLFEISFIIGVLGFSALSLMTMALSFAIGRLEGYNDGLKRAEEEEKRRKHNETCTK